jgi:hypothetical protein
MVNDQKLKETEMSEINMNENVVEMTHETKPIAKKLGRPAKIQKQMFVEMWNGSTNLNEVAETLGISKLSCSVRASNLRKEGVNLSRFKRGRKALKK